MDSRRKDLHFWRMTGAIGWSIVFQFIFLYCYVFIANLDLWHPFHVFSVSFSAVFSLKTLLNIFPLALVIICQGVLCSRDYVNQRNNQVSNTRFSLMLHFFTFRNFTTLILFSVVGVTIGCVHTSVLNDRLNSFSIQCTHEVGSICLNEKRLFLVCGGLWMGIFTFIRNYIFQPSKALIFPAIQQEKFIRIKSSFVPCVKNSFTKSIAPSFFYFICYFFKGNYLRTFFSSILSMETQNERLDSFSTLIDFELMFYLWILSSTFIITFKMMEILFNIYLTEKTEFPIAIMLPVSTDNMSLNNALMCDSIPIIQHLGFYDLAFLAEFDCERRAQLFTLSQPGGHARTWNSISGQCFKLINTFIDNLDKAFDETRITSGEGNANKKHELSAHQSTIQDYVYSPRIRCLSPVVQARPVSPSTIQKSYEQVFKTLNSWFDEKLNIIYKKPLIVYLFGDMIEPKVKQLLFDKGQPVSWAVKSMSLLACSSLREDYFGVVQKDLTIIIVTLVHLKQSLEKLQKQNIYNKKTHKTERIDLQIKNSLRWTVKQSLYRIAITFGGLIRDIDLPSDVQQQMLNFVSFKEV